MSAEPLIYTTKGNLPVASLRHEVEWRIEAAQIVFLETYFLGDEIVKQNAHVKVLTGASMAGEASI